jgi:small subunit ribosomal protein S6
MEGLYPVRKLCLSRSLNPYGGVMNIYENIVILRPSLNEEDLKSAVNKITDVIVSSGGEVLSTDNWGKKKLVYEINKHKMGIYVLFVFKSRSSVVKRIEDYFKVFDPVVKFMVIKLGKKQVEALPEIVRRAADVRTETVSPAEAAAKV